MRTLDVLESVAWGMHHFGSVFTGRALPRRDMLKAAALGLVQSIGPVLACDEDCNVIEPERYREGWTLTEAGIRDVREFAPSTAEAYLSNVKGEG